MLPLRGESKINLIFNIKNKEMKRTSEPEKGLKRIMSFIKRKKEKKNFIAGLTIGASSALKGEQEEKYHKNLQKIINNGVSALKR
jgi:hypothetical protein